MARPQTVTDEEILQTALDCILERGSSVSLDVIAGKLGISSQAVLKRFHSKQELVFAALRPPDSCPWHELVRGGPTNAPIDEQLLEIGRAMQEFMVDIVRRFSVIRFSGLDPRKLMKNFQEPPPLTDIRVLAEWFDRAAERGLVQPGDSRMAALMLMSVLHTPAMLEDIMGFHPISDDQEQNLRSMVNLLVTGLRPSPPVAQAAAVDNVPVTPD